MVSQSNGFILQVQQVFRFTDGSTLLVGKLIDGVDVRTPSTVELVVDNQAIGKLRLVSQRMLGPKQDPMSRNVVTFDEVPTDIDYCHDCLLRCAEQAAEI